MSSLFIDAVFGFELSEYFIGENDGSFTVSVALQQNELQIPVSVKLSAEDISTCMFVCITYQSTS